MIFAVWLGAVVVVGVVVGSWYGPQIAFGEKAWTDLLLAALIYVAVVTVTTYAGTAIGRHLRGRS